LRSYNRISCGGGMGEEVRFHLVSSSKVYSPISERVLGVRNLLLFN